MIDLPGSRGVPAPSPTASKYLDPGSLPECKYTVLGPAYTVPQNIEIMVEISRVNVDKVLR